MTVPAKGLHIAYCSQEAALFAVMKWHYSRRMPRSKLVKFGVWEDGEYIGCVIYGAGASPALLKPYGVRQGEGCELVRVALKRGHKTATTRILGITLKMLKRDFPNLRLVVSFADPRFGHHGGIYQAGNWTYLGQSEPSTVYVDPEGKERHGRTVSATGWVTYATQTRRTVRRSKWKRSDCSRLHLPGKYRYAFPLDAGMRAFLSARRQPHPTQGDVAQASKARLDPPLAATQKSPEAVLESNAGEAER